MKRLPRNLFHSRRTRQGYTLAEMLVTLAAFGLVGGIGFAVFQDGFNQFIRNISLNKSENSIRYTLQRLKRDVTLAVQPPTLVSYDPTRVTPLMAVPVNAAGLTSAPGIRLVINPGPAYCLTPANSAADVGPTTPLPANTLTYRLYRHVPNGTNGTDPAPLPVVDAAASAGGNFRRNDRLMFLYPSAPARPAAPPWPASTQQIISEGTAPAVVSVKPGRRLTSLTVGGANATFFDVTVEDLRPGQALPGINPYNTAYVVREVAYAVWTNRDAGGNAVSRELRFFPYADDPATFTVISRDLDPDPQEQARDDLGNLVPDGAGNPQPVQPFSVRADNVTTLRVNLPIRARDYARVIAERRLSGGAPDVASEFNVSISARPQMNNRNNVRN